MRPFTAHLRLKRDRRRPDALIVQSDVPLRVHALALSLGAALVVMGHGIGQLLAPVAGSAIQVLAPVAGLVLAAAGWMALPSMVLTTRVRGDLVELRRSRRRQPLARLLPEEILAVRLAALRRDSGGGAWRLADRQVELVTASGHETVAIAGFLEARALARGLAAALHAPLRDDSPEAEAAFCLQQALFATGRWDAAPEPPEGLRLRAALERGWLVLELPGRPPHPLVRAGLVGFGGLLLVAPVLLEALPALERSAPLLVALALSAVAWLAILVITVLRAQRPTALAASPLGVKVTRASLLGRSSIVSLPPPVSVTPEGGSIELRSGARLLVHAGASELDVLWAADAIESLAGRPLTAPVDETRRART